MSATRDRRQNRLIPSLIIGGGAFYALRYTGPILVGVEINGLATLAAAFLFTSVAAIAQDAFWYLGNVFDRKSAKTASGFKGTAGWIESLNELSHELVLDDWGSYWGTFKDKELIIPIGSNSLVIGTTGSGKGVSMVQINILSIRGSKVISDMKGELSCVLARVLRERGETVHLLNIGDVFTDILGPSASYNPLCLIADNFWRSGGLLDVSDDILEISKQLDPEPVENSGKSDNTYFRDGSRNLIGFAIQMCILVDGYNATLGDVAAMLNDKQSLIRHAKWACGRLVQTHDQEAHIMQTSYPGMRIEDSPWVKNHSAEDLKNYTSYFQGLAISVNDMLDDGDAKNFGPFLSGAQFALERYNTSTRAHKITKQTSFRFSELKEGDTPVTVFIIPDVARMEAQKPVLEILQYCMFEELKRHENKHAEVHYIGDEANNFLISNLGSQLTWMRAYGGRMQLYGQNFPALEKAYGKNTVSILKSECEIILYLPGQREPETLAHIEKSLGEQSLIAEGRSGNTESQDYWITGTDYREDAKPLMTADQIRRTDKGILFVRRNKPMLVDLPPIAAIAPFRDIIDINPFHGKPFLRPVQLTIDRDKPAGQSVLRDLLSKLPKFRKREFAEQKQHLSRISSTMRTFSSLIGLWPILLILAFFLSPIGPHLRVSYQRYSSNSYLSCTYLGSRGFITPDLAPRCPLLVFINSSPRTKGGRK